MVLQLRLIEKRNHERQQSSKRFKQWHERAATNTIELPIPRWSTILQNTSNLIFRRKFRMTKEAFKELCCNIQENVGNEFISEANTGHFQASGEVRVAIELRIMAGASYLDMLGTTGFGYHSSQSMYNIFHTFVQWLNQTYSSPFQGFWMIYRAVIWRGKQQH